MLNTGTFMSTELISRKSLCCFITLFVSVLFYGSASFRIVLFIFSIFFQSRKTLQLLHSIHLTQMTYMEGLLMEILIETLTSQSPSIHGSNIFKITTKLICSVNAYFSISKQVLKRKRSNCDTTLANFFCRFLEL